MFALLFDRRSLIVTGVALAGVAGLLFAAGVVTGLTLRRERVVVPPYWLKYGPVETSDVRATDLSRRAAPAFPTTGSTGAGARAGDGAAESVSPAPAGDGAAGDAATPPDWVPFSRPGDPTPPETSPPDGGVRATPPGGVLEEGSAQGGVSQGEAQRGGAKQDGGTPPPAGGPGGEGAGGSSDGGSGGGTDGAANAQPGPDGGVEVPRATTRRAAADCPEPGQPTWYVQTGAYAVAGNARVRHDSLQARFAAGGPHPYLSRTVSSSGVELTLVRLGPFATRQAARRAAAALDDAFVGVEAGGAAGLCGGGEDSGDAVAGRGTATVALADRIHPAG